MTFIKVLAETLWDWKAVLGALMCFPIPIIYGEEKLNPALKKDMAAALNVPLLKFFNMHTARVYGSFFHDFFGDNMLSRKRLVRAFAFTIISMAFSVVIVEQILPPANYAAIIAISHYDFVLVRGALIMFIWVLIIDYMSIAKSALLIKLITKSQSVIVATMAFIGDIAVTAMMFVVLFPIGFAIAAVSSSLHETFPLQIRDGGNVLVFSTLINYAFGSYLHQLSEGIGDVGGFIFSLGDKKLTMSFVRIPFPMEEGSFGNYIVHGKKYPMMSYVYPYTHSFLSSFASVIWSASMLFGIIAVKLQRALATSVIVKVMRYNLAQSLLKNARLGFSSVLLSAAGIMAIFFYAVIRAAMSLV